MQTINVAVEDIRLERRSGAFLGKINKAFLLLIILSDVDATSWEIIRINGGTFCVIFSGVEADSGDLLSAFAGFRPAPVSSGQYPAWRGRYLQEFANG